MFDIKDTILACDVSVKDIEDDSVEGCEHFYVYFDNGFILSILRGVHPTSLNVMGNPSTGTAEGAVLKNTLFGAMPYDVKNNPIRGDLDSQALAKLIRDIKERDTLDLYELIGDLPAEWSFDRE